MYKVEANNHGAKIGTWPSTVCILKTLECSLVYVLILIQKFFGNDFLSDKSAEIMAWWQSCPTENFVVGKFVQWSFVW